MSSPDDIDGKQLEAAEELAVQWKNFWGGTDFETLFEESDFDAAAGNDVRFLGRKLYQLYWNHRREHFDE